MLSNVKNLFDFDSSVTQSELLSVLASTKSTTIERIVSKGHTSPEQGWYQQSQHEFVLLIEGTAELTFEQGIVPLQKGDYLTINAGQKHKVTYTSTNPPAIWLTVYF